MSTIARPLQHLFVALTFNISSVKACTETHCKLDISGITKSVQHTTRLRSTHIFMSSSHLSYFTHKMKHGDFKVRGIKSRSSKTLSHLQLASANHITLLMSHDGIQ